MAEFKDLMDGFGVVTVMNACIYKLKTKRYTARSACSHSSTTGGALIPDDFVCTGLYLDTLKIANLTQSGPTKTVTGGQYANPLIKYGKTMTCEMQDALGRAATMVEFFGCTYDETSGRLSVTDKFPGAFAIEGDSFFIDQQTGDKVTVHIFIPQFIPDAILTLTQDAEGDATVFDLNGTVSVTKVADSSGSNPREIFYEIRKTPFFENVGELKDSTLIETAWDWHNGTAPSAATILGTPVVTLDSQNKLTSATVKDASGYQVEKVTQSGVVTIETFTPTTGITLDNGMKARVRAYKTADGKTTYSEWSEYKTYI